jgi:hypothetical protein
MNPDYALKEESVHDKSWESNIRERFRQIEEENSKLPQNLNNSENQILDDLCERIKLFSNGYVKHKIHQLDKYLWDDVQMYEEVQKEFKEILKNETLHCENFNKKFPWGDTRYSLNHQIAHSMVRSLCHLHPMNLKKLIIRFALPEGFTYNPDEHLMAQKTFLSGILTAEIQLYLPLMNDWDARFLLYIQNNTVLLGNLCIGLEALGTDCCLIPFRNDWRSTISFFEQKSGPFYQFFNGDLQHNNQLTIVQDQTPQIRLIKVQNSLTELRLLDDIDFHYLIVRTWDPNIREYKRTYIWDKNPNIECQQKTDFTRDVMQAVQKAKRQFSCKFWEQILLETPLSLNYRRSLYVEHDPIYTPEIDSPSEVWLKCYVCNELIGIAQAIRPWEGLLVTKNTTEQGMAQSRPLTLSKSFGKLDARMNFLNDFIFQDNSSTSGITHRILQTNTVCNPYIVDFKRSKPYSVNLKTSSGHLSYTINIDTSISMVDLNFEDNEGELLQVLEVLSPGIIEESRRKKLLNFIKKEVRSSINSIVRDTWEEQKPINPTMLMFLEQLKKLQNRLVKEVIGYFWRIFDPKIYKQCINFFNCPEIQGLNSTNTTYNCTDSMYDIFFNLYDKCSWDKVKVEENVQEFRNLVMRRNWNSIDKFHFEEFYGSREEQFENFFYEFVHEFEFVHVNRTQSVESFMSNCETNNKAFFMHRKIQHPEETIYQLEYKKYGAKFWISDKLISDKLKREKINFIEIPNSITISVKINTKSVLQTWRYELQKVEHTGETGKKLFNFISKEIDLMWKPLTERNGFQASRIEKRQVIVDYREAERKKSEETAARREQEEKETAAKREQEEKETAARRAQEIADDLTFTKVNNLQRREHIPKRKTTDEIIADDGILAHSQRLFRKIYHHELDAGLLPDFFKMREETMTEKAQQKRIRDILEHFSTYATKQEAEGSRDQEVQEIWKITNPDFVKDVGLMTTAFPIIEHILPKKDGIRSLDDLAKSIIKEYMRIDLKDGTPLERNTIDKTFKLALIIDKARTFASYSSNTLQRIYDSNLNSKNILTALEANTERYEEMLTKLDQPESHRQDIEAWIQNFEINEDVGIFWKNIFDQAKNNARKSGVNDAINNAVRWFLKQKTSGACRRTQAQAISYIEGLSKSGGEHIEPLISNVSDFKYERYEGIPGFPKRNTPEGKWLYNPFTVEKFHNMLIKLKLVDPNAKTIPRKYRKWINQLAEHKRLEHINWKRANAQKLDFADRLNILSTINNRTPAKQTQPDSDVEVKKSSEYNSQTNENDPSLPAREGDPTLPARNQTLPASGNVTGRVVLHNRQTYTPTARHRSLHWQCNVCACQFQTWEYIPPEASVEQVDEVREIIIPIGQQGLRDHIKYTLDHNHDLELRRIEHYEKMTFEAERRCAGTNSWTVADNARVGFVVPRKKEMLAEEQDDNAHLLLPLSRKKETVDKVDEEKPENSWLVKETPETIEKYTYQSIDDSVKPVTGTVGDDFYNKTFYFFNYIEAMKVSLYKRQQGPAAIEVTEIFDRSKHEKPGLQFSIKLFETATETESREHVEAINSGNLMSQAEELALWKSGRRTNHRLPGAGLERKSKQDRVFEKSYGNMSAKDKENHSHFIRDEIDRDREKHDPKDDQDEDDHNQTYIQINGQKYYFA